MKGWALWVCCCLYVWWVWFVCSLYTCYCLCFTIPVASVDMEAAWRIRDWDQADLDVDDTWRGPELSLDPFFSLGWVCWGLNWLLQVFGKDSGIVEMRCAFFHASSSPREVTLMPSGVTECDIAQGASCVNGTRKKKVHSTPFPLLEKDIRFLASAFPCLFPPSPSLL